MRRIEFLGGKLMEKYISMCDNENLTREEFLPVWKELKKDLNSGKVRVVIKEKDGWKVNSWVKKLYF